MAFVGHSLLLGMLIQKTDLNISNNHPRSRAPLLTPTHIHLHIARHCYFTPTFAFPIAQPPFAAHLDALDDRHVVIALLASGRALDVGHRKVRPILDQLQHILHTVLLLVGKIFVGIFRQRTNVSDFLHGVFLQQIASVHIAYFFRSLLGKYRTFEYWFVTIAFIDLGVVFWFHLFLLWKLFSSG